MDDVFNLVQMVTYLILRTVSQKNVIKKATRNHNDGNNHITSIAFKSFSLPHERVQKVSRVLFWRECDTSCFFYLGGTTEGVRVMRPFVLKEKECVWRER